MDIVCIGAHEDSFLKLKQLGVEYNFIEHVIDIEDGTSKDAPAFCEKNCSAMIAEYREKHPESFIIAQEQIVVFNDEIQKRPPTVERATKQIFKISGKDHEVFTGVEVAFNDFKNSTLCSAKVSLRPISLMECFAYSAFDQTDGTPGGYRINKAGLGLVEKIESENASSVYGLPLNFTIESLLTCNYELPFLVQK